MPSHPLRRSSRLNQLSGCSNSNGSRHTPPSPASNTQASLMGLSPELRLLIYHHCIVSERPFMIGRYQEDRKNKTRGGPRDLFNRNHKVHRDDRPHRPIKPPITRVCRLLREESLPLFYQENQFWLIHNEFRDEDTHPTAKHPRRFNPWLEQTPAGMFDVMQHISLCGYTDWPNRIMVTLDLKNRQVTAVKEYSMYGDLLPEYEGITRAEEGALRESRDENGFTALKAVLAKCDGIYDLSTEHISAPPGISKTRKPMEGPEYDW